MASLSMMFPDGFYSELYMQLHYIWEIARIRKLHLFVAQQSISELVYLAHVQEKADSRYGILRQRLQFMQTFAKLDQNCHDIGEAPPKQVSASCFSTLFHFLQSLSRVRDKYQGKQDFFDHLAAA